MIDKENRRKKRIVKTDQQKAGTSRAARRIEPGESTPRVKSFTPFGREKGFKKKTQTHNVHGGKF